ncbi:MAG: chemotaxis protein CheB [Deltaproteobacteria bacterium]|nr:chemotaxis protein CheB [Nannocystaceae bacterium]
MAVSSARNIVVIGASSGGVEALSKVVGALPNDFPGAVFIVQHTSPSSPALLAKILARESSLPVETAVDGEPILPGRVRVAPPDRHLLLTPDQAVLDRGPLLNRVRPAIDALFRSAAVHHGPAVVGVVLTGNLSDGSAGLAAIKACGGAALVQAPDEAAFPDMPRNAIKAAHPDHVVTLAQMPAHILRALAQPLVPHDVPLEIQLEAIRGLRTGAESVPANDRIGSRVPFTCPDCGGPLWELGAPTRFRCQIGHAYDGPTMMVSKTEEAVRALWIAVRNLDERASLLASMAATSRTAKRPNSAGHFDTRHAELVDAADAIRRLIDDMAAHAAVPAADPADPAE